jgi:hypothetical protein
MARKQSGILARRYDWAADQDAAVESLDFSTDTKPCGVLGACKASRVKILSVYRSVIESKGGKKIRFDGENDIILLHGAEHLAIEKRLLGCPGTRERSSPAKFRDYTRVFTGVKTLTWSEPHYLSTTRKLESLWMISQFTSVEKLFLGDGCLLKPEAWDLFNKNLNGLGVKRCTQRRKSLPSS